MSEKDSATLGISRCEGQVAVKTSRKWKTEVAVEQAVLFGSSPLLRLRGTVEGVITPPRYDKVQGNEWM